MRNIGVILVLLAFGAYSAWVMWHHGYLGIWQAGIANAAALQILLDLVITCLLISGWMIVDARAKGLNAWPFVGITVAAGSFGPLLYLLYRERLA
jgi:hypothetical protein